MTSGTKILNTSEKEANGDIIVSVCVVVYNGEKFIEEALDSILKQEFDLPLEIDIGDDCSTDKTREICERYKEKYPEIIRLHINEKNFGYSWNFYWTLERCRGKYVAVLDSDDIWTDPLKLKKQVAFLDDNPKYSLCFSKYYLCDEDSKLGKVTGFSGHYILNDVLSGKCPGTRTVIFRKEFFPANPPQKFSEILWADHILFVLIAQHGPIYGIDEALAAYRMNPDSIYSSKSMKIRSLKIIESYNIMKLTFKDRDYLKAIEVGIIEEYIKLGRYYFFTFQLFSIIGIFYKMLSYDLRNAKTSLLRSWISIVKTTIKIILGRMSLKQARS